MTRNLVIPWVLFVECILLTVCQKKDECVTVTTIEPNFVTIGRTRRLKIICKGSLDLRLKFDQNPVMAIQKLTSSGPVTLATLDGNDTARKFVDNITIRPFFPTNFEVAISNPGCSDVTSYVCRVNLTNSTCASSNAKAKVVKINGTDGAPRLTVSPLQKNYTDGETVVLECSSAFYSMRRVFAWNWIHPLGKEFPKGNRSQRLERFGRTCNRTSAVTLTLKADDNGARVFCVTGAVDAFNATIILTVVGIGSTPGSFEPIILTDAPPQGCVPGYSLGLLAILVLVFSITIYTAVLVAGGTKLKFPFRKWFGKKDHVYEIPDRGSSVEVENRYYSLKGVQPTYVNSHGAQEQQRVYEDVDDSQ